MCLINLNCSSCRWNGGGNKGKNWSNGRKKKRKERNGWRKNWNRRGCNERKNSGETMPGEWQRQLKKNLQNFLKIIHKKVFLQTAHGESSRGKTTAGTERAGGRACCKESKGKGEETSRRVRTKNGRNEAAKGRGRGSQKRLKSLFFALYGSILLSLDASLCHVHNNARRFQNST